MYKVISFNQENLERFEAFVLEQNGDFQQSYSWGMFQQNVRGRFFALGVERNGELVAAALLICHGLPFGMCWLNCPRGPVFKKSGEQSDLLLENEKNQIWQILFQEIRVIARKQKAVFLRIEPDERKFLGNSVDVKSIDSSHPWAKVTEFKLKFGGGIFQYHPPLEYVFRHFWYFVIILIKNLRGFFRGLKHRTHSGNLSSFWKKAGFRFAHDSYQPVFTSCIDLQKTDPEILSQMKPKGRYNIRVAEKKGVTVGVWPTGSRPNVENWPNVGSLPNSGVWPKDPSFQDFEIGNDEALDIFFSLLQETNKRDQFFSHDRKFYNDFLEILGSRGLAKLYLAKNSDNFLAGILVVFWGNTATYLYGASSSSNREFMAPYLLQWTAMKEAQKRGCRQYDLFGVSPIIF